MPLGKKPHRKWHVEGDKYISSATVVFHPRRREPCQKAARVVFLFVLDFRPKLWQALWLRHTQWKRVDLDSSMEGFVKKLF